MIYYDKNKQTKFAECEVTFILCESGCAQCDTENHVCLKYLDKYSFERDDWRELGLGIGDWVQFPTPNPHFYFFINF